MHAAAAKGAIDNAGRSAKLLPYRNFLRIRGKEQVGVKQAVGKRAAKGGAEKVPPVGRRERNKREKLDRILASARDLFAAKGFSDTTTQEIAERADIGTGTLFLYAKTKEDLLIMVFKDEMIETSQTAFRKVSPEAPLVDQLMQVFLNLLKNAAQVADDTGGEIKIRTFYDHSLRLRRIDGSGNKLPLQVEIIDNGPGIPPEIVDQIFEPFVSGRENGTGLGLALVSKIVSDHDGWISVDSVPGKTVFRISLPVAPKDKE